MSLVVVDYDASWPATFERLRQRIWPALAGVATAIEHVGSTSVPGLSAKPIIDMTVVVPTAAEVPIAIGRLAELGYAHRGNLGVDGREAFDSPRLLPRHHVYLCPTRSLALRNHLLVRDHLRRNPAAVERYGALKKRLAREHALDVEAYTAGKTDLILEILAASGLDAAALDAIQRVNRRS